MGSTLASTARKVMTGLVIALSVLLFVLVTQYVLSYSVLTTQKLVSLCISIIALTGAHFWVSNLKLIPGRVFPTMVLSLLATEFLLSIVMLTGLVFRMGPWMKLVAVLMTLQIIHLAMYTLNWFFFDEREIRSHKSLTAQEISELDLSTGSSLAPRYQSNTDE